MLELIYRHISLQALIWAVVFLPLLGAAFNGAISVLTAGKERALYKQWTAFIGCLAPILSFLAVLTLFFTLIGFEAGTPSAITGPLFKWIVSSDFMIDVGLKVDQLSLVMALMVSGVGALIHIYSAGYMWNDEGFARYFAELNLFLFFMLLLVLADNLVLMFVGWEGVGLCSYLLIGYWFDDPAKAKAGTKAFIINRIGDVCFLGAIFLIFGVMKASGADSAVDIFNFETMGRYSGYFLPISTAISLLLFSGAVAKSAQIPLHVWLPDAMAGPTPVSALIHAATMVTAGVYMIVRLNFIFVLSPFALSVIAIVGTATAIYGALLALTENNIKRILAYSTISQLGYMFLAIGIGAFSAAAFHMIIHSFFKALLFLCAGSVIFALGGEEDIRKMGGLKDRMPVTAWTFMIAAIALAGIFPASGFFSKDAILWQAYERGHTLIWVIGFLGAGLSSFYIFRLAGSVFFGEPNSEVEVYKKVSESPISMVVPMMLLATLSALGGLVGVSEIFGGSNHLGLWIGDLIQDEISRAPGNTSQGAHLILTVITMLWSAHFSILGWLIYAQKRDWPDRISRKFSPVYKVLVNKFYVNEIYDLVIIRPVIWFSRNILWKVFDKTLIDGVAVEGSSRVIGVIGLLASAAQSGLLQHYLLYFLIGAVVVVACLAL
ncbi:MAG: NADH-quinone oxidoreductase subunit L [Deltaproteobacteria bacterium]|jgi:NADH-quinone oxidoreductase subunit L|nr:NADH-quinone oxidoreductase subunit L [Deltaproteobacteria bacterium]